jgi:hypothetical protein
VTFRLRVGGLTLALRGERLPRRSPAVLRRFAAVRGADIALRLEHGAPPRPDGALLFESGGLWRVHAHAGGRLYLVSGPRPGDEPFRGVSVDGRLRAGVLHEGPGAARLGGFPLDYPLGPILLQHRLALEGAVEVHACGVVVGGRALVFAGASGAGKSTLARVWRRRGTSVLSDDRIVLRLYRGRLHAWGTPWHGTAAFATPARAPLGALFFLKQAGRSAAVPLAPAEAAPRLFARSFPPPWDARGVEGALEVAAEAARGVPAFELRFRPDGSAIAAALGAAQLAGA